MARAPLAISCLTALLAACGGSMGRNSWRAGLACPPCPFAAVCVDDPRDACDPAVTACPGICVVPVSCGGIAGIPCPAGQVCVDDPRDDCAPPNGADCAGLCAPSS